MQATTNHAAPSMLSESHYSIITGPNYLLSDWRVLVEIVYLIKIRGSILGLSGDIYTTCSDTYAIT